jgi:mono/diheme cytochrome c family protein
MICVRRLAVAAGTIFATIAAFPAAAADAERGAESFQRFGCWTCHGYDGHGASTGPKIGPDPIPLDAMRAYIREPANMPPYTAAVMSDEEIADIHAWLQTRPQPANIEDTLLAD